MIDGFLIIGVGSIGRRHLENLISLGAREVAICDRNPQRLEALIKEFSDVRLKPYVNLKDPFCEGAGLKAAVISTPSSLHLPVALECARKGLDIFIEKPLSDAIEGVEELQGVVEKNGIVAMMGMCYRFNPVFLRLKSILDSGRAGKVYHVNYFGGHYLPDWHPGADYRTEYAAQKRLGGGVVLTSIHGLDNIRWLFGEIREAAAFMGKAGPLEMDTEDMAASVLMTEGGAYVSWQSDFLNRANMHRMTITAERATITCDFIRGEIDVYSVSDNGWKSEVLTYDPNEMYVKEMSHFLDCMASRTRPLVDVNEGIRTLKLALGLKASSEKRIVVSPANGNGL